MQVFDVYQLVLRKLAIKATTPEGSQYLVMPPTNDSLHRFGNLFTASMQAPNERFVLAFREMWASTFVGAKVLSYPPDVEVLFKGLRELNMGVETVGLECSLLPLPRIEATQPQAKLPPASNDLMNENDDASSIEASGRSAAESAYDADTSSTSPLKPEEEQTQPSALPTLAVELAPPAHEGATFGETLVVAAPDEAVPATLPETEEADKAQATPTKKRRRQPSAPRSLPRSSKRRRANSEESIVPATPSQPFEDAADEADIQDIIEMEPPAQAPPPAAKAFPTPARKKANTPRRSLTKSASSGGLVSAVSSWIPRFFGSPALQADEEETVDGELDVSVRSSPDKGSATWHRLQKERSERTLVIRSKAHGGSTAWPSAVDGLDDLFTPRVPAQNVSIDLTMASEDDDDAVVPESDDKGASLCRKALPQAPCQLIPDFIRCTISESLDRALRHAWHAKIGSPLQPAGRTPYVLHSVSNPCRRHLLTSGRLSRNRPTARLAPSARH